MWIELLIGATLLVVVLSMQREHMATGVYNKDVPPTDAESSEIFDQIMYMAPSILHTAYAEALVFAQSALAEAKTFATKVPDDQMLKVAAATSDDKVVQYAKNGVATAVVSVGHEMKMQGIPITEENLKTLVENLYTKLNEHIDDKLPPVVPQPNETPVQAEMGAKIREYAERARALVKKYDTPEVRDACVLVLKQYYIDQLKPDWTTSRKPTPAADPTTGGNMTDLEAEYQRRKIVYDNLVADALAKNDASKVDAIAAAKQAMNETLNKMLALSAKTGTADQQEELVRRIMEIQRDYNGLLVATDKLETLRRIHQFMDERGGSELKLYGIAFFLATMGLFIMVIRTH
jgi:hypothetical protein